MHPTVIAKRAEARGKVIDELKEQATKLTEQIQTMHSSIETVVAGTRELTELIDEIRANIKAIQTQLSSKPSQPPPQPPPQPPNRGR